MNWTWLTLPFAFSVISKARAVDAGIKLMYEITGVSNLNFKNWKFNFALNITFFNPTAKKITINYIYLKIGVNGVDVASVKQLDKPITISARSETVVSVPVSVSLTSLLAAGAPWVKNFLETGQLPQQFVFTAKGYVRAENTTIPIDTDYVYKLDI